MLDDKPLPTFAADLAAKASSIKSLPHLVAAGRGLSLLDPSSKDKAAALISSGLDGGRGITLSNCLEAAQVNRMFASKPRGQVTGSSDKKLTACAFYPGS